MSRYTITFDRTLLQRRHVDIEASNLEEAQKKADELLSSGELRFIRVVDEKIIINSIEED